MVVAPQGLHPRRGLTTGLALSAFAVVFVALTVSSYTQQSATIDEPQHLTAGYTAWKLGNYRVDPEHPPFLRMWAALPLLAMRGVSFDSSSLGRLSSEPLGLSHEFLYQNNDADRLLYRARLMIVALGVLLGIVLFRWAQELYGFWPAVIVLGLYATEPNILAHASLVTTDFGVACFIFITIYALWRLTQALTPRILALLLASCALAHVSKFSALTLWPMVLTLVLVRALRSSAWPGGFGPWQPLAFRAHRTLAAVLIMVSLLLVSYGAIWAIYGFRYTPAPEASGLLKSIEAPVMLGQVPTSAGMVRWVDDHRLLPKACTQGFLLGQVMARNHPSFLAGRISEKGWWYYFPVVFLLKTPVALILLFLGGLALLVIQRDARAVNDVFLLVPIGVYMAVAMMAPLNIGVRHILPIYPFVLLIAGKAVQALWAQRRNLLKVALGVLCLFQVEEVALVRPHYLAFFNQFIGGPQNGCKYLADSNLDWGQDLKGLRQWMTTHGIRFVNLSYFGLADPAYYGINCSYLYPSPFFADGRPDEALLPGYVAVSVQNLLGVSLDPPRPDLYKKLLESEPVAVIGYSIRVYWVERPWR